MQFQEKTDSNPPNFIDRLNKYINGKKDFPVAISVSNTQKKFSSQALPGPLSTHCSHITVEKFKCC